VTRPQTTAEFFEVLASGHHGYPQPQDDYHKAVYENACPRCGIHGRQIHPFRFTKSLLAPHSAFLQLNWVFDAFFVHREVADTLILAGVTGITFRSVVNHRTGSEINDRVQMLIETIVSCGETTRLFAMTCRPDNEEVIGLRNKFPNWKSWLQTIHQKLTVAALSIIDPRQLALATSRVAMCQTCSKRKNGLAVELERRG
jgi:hypothetical protein